MEQVILVNYDDGFEGVEEKMKAHESGLLHRAFSVFLFHDEKILIQKRASSKYHCGSLWTNTCCSHPRLNESVLEAALRRLDEELGIVVDHLDEVGHFVYYYPFSNGLIEYEYDHVLIGEYDGDYQLNYEEVDDLKWVDIQEVKEDVRLNPSKYTPWFIVALNMALEKRK
ncbi:MAG: isopentenyl-diphosphate Delta-isomerase [Traorella sp.]